MRHFKLWQEVVSLIGERVVLQPIQKGKKQLKLKKKKSLQILRYKECTKTEEHMLPTPKIYLRKTVHFEKLEVPPYEFEFCFL